MAREASARRSTLPLAVALVLALVAVALATGSPGQASDADPLTAATVGDLALADEDEGPRDGVRATFVADALAPGDQHTAYLRLSTHGMALDDAPEDTRRRVDHRRIDLRVVQDAQADTGLGDHIQVLELTYGPTDLLERVQAACGPPVTLATLIGCASQPGGPLADLAAPGPGRDLVMTVQLDPMASNELQGQAVGFDVEATLHSPLLETADHHAGGSPPSSPRPPTGQGASDRGSDQHPSDPSAGPDRRPPTPSTPAPAEEGSPSSALTLIGWADSQPSPPATIPRTSVARLLIQEEPMLEQALVPHLFDGIGPQVLPVGAAEPPG